MEVSSLDQAIIIEDRGIARWYQHHRLLKENTIFNMQPACNVMTGRSAPAGHIFLVDYHANDVPNVENPVWLSTVSAQY
jgi:hypothetical protein